MHQGQGENPVEFPLVYTHRASKKVWKGFKTQNLAVVCLYLEADFQ